MQIGPYTVLGEVARGGMGVVYRARGADGRVVALKLLLAESATGDRAGARFQSELNALSRLQHPHVVSLLEAGEHEGRPWLALEFVEGESLQALLRHGPLPIENALRLVRQLASALSYVHGCGVLHRDLKPDNVMLRDGHALLTDFGLVLDDENSASRLTRTGNWLGTPGYWAPEQAAGQTDRFGPRTDVYGLGAVLYACLTGMPPVQADSLGSYMQVESFTSISPPQTVRSETPRWLSELCMRCMAFDPEARPPSADAVARALTVGGWGAPRSTVAWRRQALGAAALAIVTAGLGWALSGDRSGGGGLEQRPPSVPGEVSEPLAPPAEPSVQRVEALMSAAVEANGAKRYADAIEVLNEVLQIDPQHTIAYTLRGASKAGQRRFLAAIEDYDTAIEVQATYAEAHLLRGASQARLGRHAEAIADFTNAIAFASEGNDPRAYSSRGISEFRLGRYEEAIEDFDQGILLGDREADSYLTRGVCKASLGRYESALEDFDAAIAIDPLSGEAHLNRALSKAALGRHAAAIPDYDASLELEPDVALAYSSRGSSKLSLGQHAEALDDLNAALALEPNDPLSFADRGSCKAGLGRYAAAIEDFDAALRIGLVPQLAEDVRGRRAQAVAMLTDVR